MLIWNKLTIEQITENNDEFSYFMDCNFRINLYSCLFYTNIFFIKYSVLECNSQISRKAVSIIVEPFVDKNSKLFQKKYSVYLRYLDRMLKL